jgi:trehalose 6-phosphate phosphatase
MIGFDFDGTLAPIVADPGAARAHPGAVPALRGLASLVGTVFVLTGRPAAVAVEYGGFAGVGGLLVLGHYGRERWENGVVTAPPPPPGIAEARRKLDAILRNAPEGIFVEDKGQAVAVHTRNTAEPEAELERLRGIVGALAERTGLAVEPGRFVLELRPPGMDKGTALRGLAAERSATAVLFAGDDLGDLAAYDAIEALRAEGTPGVTVCSSSEEVTALAERADLVVDGPAGVVALIESLTADLS